MCMEADPDTVQRGVHVIVNETERLSEMVEELLDFSRMQSGRFSLQCATMDVLAELGDAVLIYTEKAKRENIRIIYQEPEMLPFVYGDKNRIRQVFINVIDNAIKYSNSGSTITISAEEVGNMIQVTITDNGVGISEADLPRVKTKFFKANGFGTESFAECGRVSVPAVPRLPVPVPVQFCNALRKSETDMCFPDNAVSGSTPPLSAWR